ncbi:MAG TPA: hypothetical protein VJU86_19230 [Pyrinomonadaceae bacterium]|nr:hypothetical protein [Pyrinomonadaceae bacterium]
MPQDARDREISLSASDINRAAAEGVLSQSDADRLVGWAYDQRFASGVIPEPRLPAGEQRKGFNLVTVLYYFGAMLMISACAWFLGDKWDTLGTTGVFITTLVYLLIAVSVGRWLRANGYTVAGGLLITVGVCLVPLLTYCIEKMTGLWPAEDPGEYQSFYPWIHGSWIVMELATIVAAALALKFVRFSFLTAPMAFCFWFLSMDLAGLIFKQNSLDSDTTKWVSVLVGLVTLAVGYGLDRTLRQRDAPATEDFAFWCYLFGLMAFWGGLTSMDSGSEFRRFIYLLINLALVGIAVKLKRAVFLVFGALGAYIYVGHLAWEVFKDSVFFPLILAFLGLSLILGTVWGQRYWRQRLAKLN